MFEQIAVLRRERTMSPLTAAQRVINQLTVRVAEHTAVRPAIWMYGSATVGLEIIEAIRRHRWLPNAVTIGGFLSSPGYGTADLLHGYRLCQAGELPDASDALIVVSSETSRLSIQEELTRLNLLDRIDQRIRADVGVARLRAASGRTGAGVCRRRIGTRLRVARARGAPRRRSTSVASVQIR